MKNHLFQISLLVIVGSFISACSHDTITDSEIFLAQEAQNHCRHISNQGLERILMLREIVTDKSESEIYRQRVKETYETALKTDSITANAFRELEDLKQELLRSIGEGQRLDQSNKLLIRSPYDPNQPLWPADYNLFEVKYRGNTDFTGPSGQAKQIHTILENYRRDLLTKVAQRSAANGEKFFFRVPMMSNYKNRDDLVKMLGLSMRTSHIFIDDQQAVQEMYLQLSLNDEEMQRTFSDDCPWTTAFQLLVQWQYKILDVRERALYLIASRIGCRADYGFNHIVVLTTGKELMHIDEKLEFEVFYGAYNSSLEPKLVCTDAEILPNREGRGRIRFTPQKLGEQILKGTIAVSNKAGIPKMMAWEKPVLVVE